MNGRYRLFQNVIRIGIIVVNPSRAYNPSRIQTGTYQIRVLTVKPHYLMTQGCIYASFKLALTSGALCRENKSNLANNFQREYFNEISDTTVQQVY
jgi:hypothetical protein